LLLLVPSISIAPKDLTATPHNQTVQDKWAIVVEMRMTAKRVSDEEGEEHSY